MVPAQILLNSITLQEKIAIYPVIAVALNLATLALSLYLLPTTLQHSKTQEIEAANQPARPWGTSALPGLIKAWRYCYLVSVALHGGFIVLAAILIN